ncbi:MAG TPA: hypothetical protein PKA00_20840 [Saprospiraceae bacterium]|nr:hypothetical protein [Saprospiraceae bacterium]HMQ85370.1 hypothetical protein [Saprospiraceae bacterium]
MRKVNYLPIFFLSMLMTLHTRGQNLEQLVTLSYVAVPLESVLKDIGRNYQLSFAYSREFIPADKPIHLNINKRPLKYALDEICSQSALKYAAIGGQVMLKPDNNADQSLGQLNTLKGKIRQTSPIYPEPLTEAEKAERQRWKEQMEQIDIAQAKILKTPGGNDYKEISMDSYRLPSAKAWEALEDTNAVADYRLAQISLLPFLGTNAEKSSQITNNVSVNVLWGKNGGVDGVEIGGLVNSVEKDVKGLQVAGLGSNVGGDLTGTQIGGLFNVVQGETNGNQIAGLFNRSGKSNAVQMAGLFNQTTADFQGVQIAGLFNTSAGKADGVQLAGLFNYSKATSKSQYAGLFNVSGDVTGGQISSFFNKAKKVDGFQLGLINVADSISGAPIGFLSLIRKGYNRVELSGGDLLYANLSIKLGAHAFYNIFQVGARIDDLNYELQGAQISGSYMSWGLGYGIGAYRSFGKNFGMNSELVVMHINEYESWTNELNLLAQVRLTFDHKLGRSTSLFWGPTLNAIASDRFDPENGTQGSSLPFYTLIDEPIGTTNMKAWVGFQGGFRF